VRIQDAFDRGWWERVSGGAAPSPAELPVDLDGEGLPHRFLDEPSESSKLLLDPGPIAALNAHLHSLPTATAILSTLSTLTRLLLLYTAYSIGASHLVLGTSLTSLSISLISSISQGGGFVVPQAIQEEWIPPFVEHAPGATSWRGEVRLIRPLRDVGMKECTAWVWWHKLSVVGKQRVPISGRTIGNLTKGSRSHLRTRDPLS
jgi:cytoplasmic tRNA 2-thiolation protein 2